MQQAEVLVVNVGKENTCLRITKKIWNFTKKCCKFFFKNPYGWRTLSVTIAILLAVPFFFITFDDKYPDAAKVCGVVLMMSFLWMTNAINMGVTAFIPLIAFPLLKVMSASKVSSTYINNTSFIFIGGFVLAIAMERWNLHQRITLLVMKLTGKNLSLLFFGFLLTAYLMSFWVSNTAAALIMLPNAITVIDLLEQVIGKEAAKPFGTGLFIGIAFACSIGGTTTPVSTPPNLIFMQQYKSFYPHLPAPSFLQWMLFAIPLSFTVFLFMFVILYFIYCRRTIRALYGSCFKKSKAEDARKINFDVFAERYKALGRISYEEVMVLIVFGILVAAWVTLSPIGSFKGWGSLFDGLVSDGTVAMTCAFLFFLIPAFRRPGPKERKTKDQESIDIELKSIPKLDESDGTLRIPSMEFKTDMTPSASIIDLDAINVDDDKPTEKANDPEENKEKEENKTIENKKEETDENKAKEDENKVTDEKETTENKDEKKETDKEDKPTEEKEDSDEKRKSQDSQKSDSDKQNDRQSFDFPSRDSMEQFRIQKEFSVDSIVSKTSIELERRTLMDEKKVAEKEKPKKPKKESAIMTWEAMSKFPWDIIMLFGGGFALADGVKESGLAEIFANQLKGLSVIPAWLICLLICAILTIIGSVASNTAIAQIFLPILAPLSSALNLHPMFVMLPATFTTSFSFVLPVSTPVNAVVFSSKRLKVVDMFIIGAIMSVVGWFVTLFYAFVLLPAVFSVDIYESVPINPSS